MILDTVFVIFVDFKTGCETSLRQLRKEGHSNTNTEIRMDLGQLYCVQNRITAKIPIPTESWITDARCSNSFNLLNMLGKITHTSCAISVDFHLPTANKLR